MMRKHLRPIPRTLKTFWGNQGGAMLVEVFIVFIVVGIFLAGILWLGQKAPQEAHFNGARGLLGMTLGPLRSNPPGHDEILGLEEKGLESANIAMWRCYPSIRCQGSKGTPSSGPYVFSLVRQGQGAEALLCLRIGARNGTDNKRGVFNWQEAQRFLDGEGAQPVQGEGGKKCEEGSPEKGCIVEILI